MDYVVVPLVENRQLAPATFVLRFRGCEFLADTAPGQFVMMRACAWGTDPLLPRAFSVLGVDQQGGEWFCDVLIKTSGKASHALHTLAPGAQVSLLGPLGTHFPEPSRMRHDLLVAGGVGFAPLYLQAMAARARGLADRITFFYGGRTKSDLVMLDELAATGCEVVQVTDDGSAGHRGRVTSAVERALAEKSAPIGAVTLMACGPDPMLVACAALARHHDIAAHLSLEGEMACGIGICLACAVPCTDRPFRYTCKDGPVIERHLLAGRFAESAS